MRSRLASETPGTLGHISNVPIRDPAIPNPLVTGEGDGMGVSDLT